MGSFKLNSLMFSPPLPRLRRDTFCVFDWKQKVVVGEGFEPSKAEPAELQSAPFDRFGTPPFLDQENGYSTQKFSIVHPDFKFSEPWKK